MAQSPPETEAGQPITTMRSKDIARGLASMWPSTGEKDHGGRTTEMAGGPGEDHGGHRGGLQGGGPRGKDERAPA